MNPWEEIRLKDYEGHMSLDSVKQLQALNLIIKDQLEGKNSQTQIWSLQIS